MREAGFYQTKDNRYINCYLCPHNCQIPNGKRGVCGVRKNQDGILFAESYGKITSIALDPIEKKPLKRFCPGKKILSVGSYGCNFHCGFCQNHEISMGMPEFRHMDPGELASLSKELGGKGNIGLAYTYNEPFISMEFLMDCAMLVRKQGQKNVVVTNGFVTEEALKAVLPLIDAMNIDLKSFAPALYHKIGGELENVKKVIVLAAEACHVEVTTLVIAGENDSEEEMDRLSGWLSGIRGDIPLHISRFFPAHQFGDRKATPGDTIYRLVEVAGRRF